MVNIFLVKKMCIYSCVALSSMRGQLVMHQCYIIYI